MERHRGEQFPSWELGVPDHGEGSQQLLWFDSLRTLPKIVAGGDRASLAWQMTLN